MLIFQMSLRQMIKWRRAVLIVFGLGAIVSQKLVFTTMSIDDDLDGDHGHHIYAMFSSEHTKHTKAHTTNSDCPTKVFLIDEWNAAYMSVLKQ
jgi:hypothetical protein